MRSQLGFPLRNSDVVKYETIRHWFDEFTEVHYCSYVIRIYRKDAKGERVTFGGLIGMTREASNEFDYIEDEMQRRIQIHIRRGSIPVKPEGSPFDYLNPLPESECCEAQSYSTPLKEASDAS